MNFYNVNSGAIYLGGVNIKKINLTTLRNNFSLVSQDIQIFSDTIFNNILFGKPTASREEVILAAKLSSSTPFIDQMPLGFDTCVGEQGVRLSGGQKQKLAFARAILRDAPVLLLDEATASLDSESETVMQDAIKNLAKNKTTFTIAHRLSTVKQASWIIVFDGGRIVEIGTHNQLISHDGGLYARLADLQFVK
jgi:ABC-type multidrug transport system fused ATPase/permease subunit